MTRQPRLAAGRTFYVDFSTQFLPLTGGHNHYHFQSVLINHWDTSNIIFGTYWKILQAELLLFTCLCFLLLCWASGEVQLIIAITPRVAGRREEAQQVRTEDKLHAEMVENEMIDCIATNISQSSSQPSHTHIHTTHLSPLKEGREGFL